MLIVEDVDLTPNPHALKFILNKKLLNVESRQYPSVESAANDPFAKGIFEIEGVVSVFYMDYPQHWLSIDRILDKSSFSPILVIQEVIPYSLISHLVRLFPTFKTHTGLSTLSIQIQILSLQRRPKLRSEK